MVRIRLTRVGTHKRPYFRIVVMDAKAKANGAYIENLGHYNPIDGKVVLNNERTLEQLKNGAQPSDTVKSILSQQGVWKEFTALKDANKKRKAELKKAK
ncbi:30S ribosomal protein S16 [Ureaplasma diversum]|uniref:Small ribosomal subunit protein bS16 n=1 Tax=Ureaplasma diversum TaxID=42094 RepID=A0A0C5RLH6_9BACT|nr:30S ribosomal protein S16 [Ureaplasma diversum]AJQ45538.1 30S ribosomal protein S16 [Ureaplasma diversum]